MNEQNLNPVRSKSEARERGRKGGIASAKARRERKTLREELLMLLSEDMQCSDGEIRQGNHAISVAMMREAEKGNVRAFNSIRDTVGEMPVETIKVQQTDYSEFDKFMYGQSREKNGS